MNVDHLSVIFQSKLNRNYLSDLALKKISERMVVREIAGTIIIFSNVSEVSEIDCRILTNMISGAIIMKTTSKNTLSAWR